MLAESRNCGPGSGVVGLVDEPPPKDDKKLLGTWWVSSKPFGIPFCLPVQF